MIKLTDILQQSVIKLTEGGKLFGSRVATCNVTMGRKIDI